MELSCCENSRFRLTAGGRAGLSIRACGGVDGDIEIGCVLDTGVEGVEGVAGLAEVVASFLGVTGVISASTFLSLTIRGRLVFGKYVSIVDC